MASDHPVATEDCPACVALWDTGPRGNRFRRTRYHPASAFSHPEYEITTPAHKAKGRREWACVVCNGYGVGVPDWIAAAYRLGGLHAVAQLPDLPAPLRARIRTYAGELKPGREAQAHMLVCALESAEPDAV